jgi:uncharacterized phage protein (TIGR02218 family)
MRTVPDALAARIESGAATLCHVWRLTRADGAVSGFTDHDQDLLHDGLVCVAGGGWTAGASQSGLGPGGAGSMAAAGVLDAEGLDPADLAAGLYDGATVECRRVDWSAPHLFVSLWTATISRVRRDGEAFTADLEGPMAQLQRVAGRSYGRLCDANLGDDRCGVEPSHPEYAAGCDKRFGNSLNFRGFPAIPGNDFLSRWPADGERHDGTSRRG